MFFENSFVQGHWMAILKMTSKNIFAFQMVQWTFLVSTLIHFQMEKKFSFLI